MQAVLMTILKTVSGLILQMLLGLLLSPKYLYDLVIRALRWAVRKTANEVDDKLLDAAEEEWKKKGIPEKLEVK